MAFLQLHVILCCRGYNFIFFTMTEISQFILKCLGIKKGLNHILLPLLKCLLCIDLLSQAQTSVEILKHINIVTNNK